MVLLNLEYLTMQCFRHHERAAVAVCRHCGKATCVDCSNDTGQGIACSENCTAELQDAWRLTTRLKQNFGIGSTPPMPASVSMYAFFGAILAAVGAYLSVSRDQFDYLTIAMSAVFFVMAWLSYKRFKDACMSC
jgi:hypothetical protein